MVRKRNGQHSSCPEGWLKAGIKVPISLTVRQEQYATRAAGIARSVFNLIVATHQMARAQGHGQWPSPMELGEDLQRPEASARVRDAVRHRGQQVRRPGRVV